MNILSGEKLIIDEGLVEDGQTVVLGLSGGPDSVCLLYELLSLDERRRRDGGTGIQIVCAHMNHGLRSEESDGDEAFVVGLCKALGIRAEVRHIDVAALAAEKGMTVEEAGRAARYIFFDEVCDEVGLSPCGKEPIIAVAHNRDDQIETVFMRILRGTGPDGLAGMAPWRKSEVGYGIVRPLLSALRTEIERRLAECGAAYRVDSSNFKAEHFRNKLRLHVLPYIEEAFGAGLRQGLWRLAENAAEDKAYFDAVVAEALDEYLGYGGGSSALPDSATLPADLLASAHPAIRHRLIRAAFADIGLRADIAAVHLAAADRLLTTWQDGGEASGKRVEFPGDYTFGIQGKEAVFRTPSAIGQDWKPRRQRGVIVQTFRR